MVFVLHICYINIVLQDNDIVYGLLKEKVQTTEESDPWVGGTLYCVGGRSNVWGLYIPRIDQNTLSEYFPRPVVEDLVDNKDSNKGNYYKRAEFLMHNRAYEQKSVSTELLNERERLLLELNEVLQDKNLKPDKEVVEKLIEAINKSEGSEFMDVKPIVDTLGKSLKDYSSRHFDSLNLEDLHWALLGAQFSSNDRYEFPQGAFSSTDRILEAVFRSHKNTTNKMQPTYLTVLHNTLAIQVVADKDVVTKVKTVSANGQQNSFKGKKIVLCAGSLDSPALLLRSGIDIHPLALRGDKINEEERGKDTAKRVPKYFGITDHNLYGFKFTINGGGKIEPAKLQLEGEVSFRGPTQAGGGGEKDKKIIPFLLNIAINAQSFLSRDFEEQEQESPDGVCTITYSFRSPLNNNHYVALDVHTGHPIVYAKVSGDEIEDGGKINTQIERTLSELNIFIEQTIRKAMQKDGTKTQLREEPQVWKPAGLGVVAHEVGTLPMAEDAKHGVVDGNLKFHQFANLYACDMSVLPVSAPANPSLTLVALALRLTDHLVHH